MAGSNYILSSLPADVAAALRPHLKAMHLPQKQVVYEAGDRIKSVVFPTSAIVSLVIALASGESIEAAMIGKDGAISMPAALDGKIATSQAVVQLAGDALVCAAPAFRDVALQSAALISIVMRHEQALFAQAQQSTACMANHEVAARLARWLLRARDLSGSEHLAFTQEFLAEMLGVRRTSVTTVARTLQEAGIIRYMRGQIEIVALDALRDCACECYDAVNAQYQELLKPLSWDG